MELQVGCAKVKITPEQAVPLSGFAVRNNLPYERVRSDIHLRVVLLRQSNGFGEPKQALIVSADLLWWGSDRMETIRRTLKERWGLKPETIILNATHSHSGPQSSFRFHRLLGRADADYVDQLEAKLYAAVEEAASNLEPVTVERGQGSCSIGVQRRKYVDGKVFGGAFEDGIADPNVTVVRFVKGSGAAKALFVHYTCHPVTTSANELSSEFTGHAMEQLESEMDGTVCLFLQGCCADINIYREQAPAEWSGFQAIAFFGDRLAVSVRDVLQGPMKPLAPMRLSGNRLVVPLALRPLASREKLETIAGAGESPYDEWAEEMLRKGDSRVSKLPLEVVRLDVAEGLQLLAMNAEVVVEYGLYAKALSPNVLPMGYSNGMIGYVPMEYQLRLNGYEADSSTYYFHMPAMLEPAIEADVKAAIAALVAPAGVETEGHK
ncbi:hypothetical protein [Paenibacillus koleovorans]|uniref:hypothetical protein n=1 Tax=Paenibacillus koleovorans TaxID=121608 RepID=UPI000FD78334|nr:hypothetical protein [Paenibacillus koleovorans]